MAGNGFTELKYRCHYLALLNNTLQDTANGNAQGEINLLRTPVRLIAKQRCSLAAYSATKYNTTGHHPPKDGNRCHESDVIVIKRRNEKEDIRPHRVNLFILSAYLVGWSDQLE